ncbi:MAG: hypothetical protein IH941_11190 [Acidobacteria bacterium]|nr:hypothetical protein [Acidobacteriota bacterium]
MRVKWWHPQSNPIERFIEIVGLEEKAVGRVERGRRRLRHRLKVSRP